MKKYEVHVTKSAIRDLTKAADYIEFNLFNPKAATDLEDEADAAFASLETNPDRFSVVTDPILAAQQLRFLIIKNYLAFYLIDESNNTVYVVRFLYSGQNWNDILKQGYSLE